MLHAHSLAVTSWLYDAASTLSHLIWLCGDTNDFLRISLYAFHLISYIPNIQLKHVFISSTLFWALFILLHYFSFHFKPLESLEIPHTPVWTQTQGPVSKGFTSGAASALSWQSPENTIRLIWQSKENQTASQYTKEPRSAGCSIESQFIHYGRHLQQRGAGRRRKGLPGEQQIYNKRRKKVGVK